MLAGSWGMRREGLRMAGEKNWVYNLHQLEFELFGIQAVEFFLRVRPAGGEGGHCGGGNDRISRPSTTATK